MLNASAFLSFECGRLGFCRVRFGTSLRSPLRPPRHQRVSTRAVRHTFGGRSVHVACRARRLVALDARIPPWDRRIDLVILTHPHEDHVGGLPLLLERYRVGRLFEPGMTGPGPAYAAFEAALSLRGVHSAPLSTGDRFALDGSRSGCSGPIRAACRALRPTREPGSTTCRSCCSARWARSASCSRATSRRESIPFWWRVVSPTSTFSRWPTTGAGPRRRTPC